MAWVKLDDGFPEHPKVAQAGDMAAWLYICGLTYANRQLTDGFIPDAIVPRLTGLKGSAALAKRLVDASLWELAEGGYQIHDYLNYQPAAGKVVQERQDNATRMADLRRRRSTGATRSVTDLSGESAPEHMTAFAESSGVTNPSRSRSRSRSLEEDENLEGEHPVSGAAFAAGSAEKSLRSPLIGLSDDAREAVECWRSAHGKRSPPKLNPTQANKLEKAVLEVGLEWLRFGAKWSAERGIPEFDKAINAAYTARQNAENGSNGHGENRQRPGGIGQGPRRANAGAGGGAAGEDDPFAKYVRSDEFPNGRADGP